MADEILDIAHGNRRLAAEIERTLAELAKNGSEVMREMATAVLKGEISLREVASSSTYGDEVAAGLDKFWKQYQAMSPEERTELEETGRESLGLPPTN
ncbi:hypothetical protein [Actinoplanes sp. NPDC049118]|uniref:hypothetical protein n=1 Tax=Actinoplanes sp. NPDC049118 TaxID=3155769 RepID=UPI00341179C4